MAYHQKVRSCPVKAANGGEVMVKSSERLSWKAGVLRALLIRAKRLTGAGVECNVQQKRFDRARCRGDGRKRASFKSQCL